jgi:4-hydroxybenzoate polyprenyltransferase
MSTLKTYLSLVKFSHTIFAMPFAAIGLTLGFKSAQFDANAWLILKVVLCMVFARSAAMAFNRYIDRRFDAMNARTAVREIPAGVIQPKSALVFVILNAVLFMGVTFFINPLSFFLSPVALLVILGYSYTKRFTAWCHLVLGLGLSLAPIGAYLAVTGRFDVLPIAYSVLVLTWVSGFDIIYALQDEHFDRSVSLHSIPVSFGTSQSLMISTLLHLITVALVFAIPFLSEVSVWYWIGAALFSGLLVYQHLLVKPNDLSKVNLAFATTNGVGSLIFGTFTVMDLLIQNT